jgi:hypothetical protein
MLSVIVPVVLVGALVLGPIGWRVWRDRREEQALAVRADVAAAVRQALDGESLVSVQVEPPRPLRSGRVILSVPGGWEWLIREAWTRVVTHVPRDYELVVRAGGGSAHPAPGPRDVLRRAA